MASNEIKKIAVVGAGLTGLAALRRLSENKNFKLTCFERNYDIGGLWLYTDQTLQDDYGNPVHSAVYSNLKTNIPKQLMEIDGFPMDGYPSFPSRTEMLAYLNKVVDQCGIRKYIKFNMDVKQIKPVNPSSRDTKWLLSYGDIRKKKDIHTEKFDDVIVCLGNCSTPNYPTIEGEQDFEGFVLHSIRYRHPECFAGQTVAVLGAHYSGIDISFDLSKCTKKVYLCHRGPKLETRLPENIVQKTSGFKRYTPFSVVLENGEEIPVDTVIYATGYKYNFSILPEGLLKLGKGNLICNLFKYILTPNYSTIFFMGIVREVAFFPTSEYQAFFIQSVLEGSANLPDQEEMNRIISKDSERVIGGDNQWEWIKELSDISAFLIRIYAMASNEIKKIAVVGAGLTGLAALRRLSENKNFMLTCFERNYDIGGLWLYTDQTLQDDYGNPVHSAVYSNLKTNIPKQLMEIDGFPMDGYPSFPSRTEMLAYLNKVVDQCGIRKYIKFNMDVKQIKPVNPSSRDTKWLLSYGDIRKKKDIHTEKFDDVIVCLGNCSTPNYPTIEGEQDFEGFVLHSIRYRHPECFAGQTVAVLGAHYSGIDISFDLSKCTKKVYLCHRGPKLETRLPENIVQKTSGFKRYTPFSVVLENGEEIPVDTVIYATGYKYNFSILPEGLLKLGKGNLICNLFKYILTPNYSTIFFMGIVREVAFFPTSEYQAFFIQSVLEGSANLPDQEEMNRIISKDSERVIGGNNQWEWIKELSDISGKSKALPLVMKKIWDYHFDIWGKDFAKCRSLVYKATGPDSFVLV